MELLKLDFELSVSCFACSNKYVQWWKNWTSALVLKLSSIVRWTSFARLSVGTAIYADERETPSNRFPGVLANICLLLWKWVECPQANAVLICW